MFGEAIHKRTRTMINITPTLTNKLSACPQPGAPFSDGDLRTKPSFGSSLEQ